MNGKRREMKGKRKIDAGDSRAFVKGVRVQPGTNY